MKSKNIVKRFIYTVSLISILFICSIILYDPLQVYHKHIYSNDKLTWNMRQQSLGIINHYDFDSVILGSSLLENTSAKETSKYLNGKFFNISVSGSDFYERSFILNYLLKNKKINKVLYSLDDWGLVYQRNGNPTHKVETFDYLYDDNILNDINVYLNFKYLNCLKSFSLNKECIGRKVDLDRPNAWLNNKNHIKTFGGLNNWLTVSETNKKMKKVLEYISYRAKRVKNNRVNKIKSIDKNKIEKYLNDNLLYYVKKFPNTEFIFMLPPYPRFNNAISAQFDKNNFEKYKYAISFLVGKSLKWNNMKVFGWSNYDFVDKIKYYRDTSHFNAEINSLLLKEIYGNKGLLTGNNVNSYLNDLTKKSLSYDLVGLGKKIDDYFTSKRDTK